MTWFIKVVVDVIISKLIALASGLIAKFRKKREIIKKNEELIEKLEKAETPEERENALKEILKDF